MSDNSNSSLESAEPFLTINGQYIKDLSFENPEGINSFFPQEIEPQVQASVHVQAHALPGKSYEVELLIRIEVTSEKSSLYIIDLNYAGVFTIGDIDKEILKPLLFVECARLLFPFARCIIADVTRDSGFPPFLLQLFDFVELYQREGVNNEINFSNLPEGNA